MPSIFSRRTPSDRPASGRRAPFDRPMSGRQTPFDQSIFNRQARSDRSIFSRRTLSDQPISDLHTPFNPPVTDRDPPSSKGSIWSKKNPYLGKGKPALPGVLSDDSFLGLRLHRERKKGEAWAERHKFEDSQLKKATKKEKKEEWEENTEGMGSIVETCELKDRAKELGKEMPKIKSDKERKEWEKDVDMTLEAMRERELRKFDMKQLVKKIMPKKAKRRRL